MAFNFFITELIPIKKWSKEFFATFINIAYEYAK